MTLMEPAAVDLPRRRVFGLDFVDAASVEDVIPLILSMAADHETGPVSEGAQLPIVVTPNVDHLVKLSKRRDRLVDDVARRAAVVLPDGQPIVWGSRVLGAPLRGRLSGSTLVAALTPLLVAGQRRVVVVANSSALAERIELQSTSFRAVCAPRLSVEDVETMTTFVQEVVDRGSDHRAEFVFVTVGHPKQEHLAMGVIDRWPSDRPLPVVLAVGQSFDMYFGMVRRAPRWMQTSGLEWLFRFIQEPRRLFRRYFLDDPAFLGILVEEWRARRRSHAVRETIR